MRGKLYGELNVGVRSAFPEKSCDRLLSLAVVNVKIFINKTLRYPPTNMLLLSNLGNVVRKYHFRVHDDNSIEIEDCSALCSHMHSVVL